MKQNKILAVCFDMWGTLFEGGGGKEWEDLQQNLRALDIEKKKFYRLGLKNLLLHPWPLREGIRHLANILNLNADHKTINKAYRSWWQIVEKSKPYPEVKEVLDKLEQLKIRKFIISNTDSQSFYYEIKKFDLKKYFERFFISSQIGSLKHEGKMFELAHDYLSFPKNQVLMVDDSLNHGVEPARQFGWQALWIARGRKEKYTNKIDDLRGIFDFL